MKVLEIKKSPRFKELKKQVRRKIKDYSKVCGGRTHTTSSCYFKDRRFYECDRKGHLAKVCKEKNDQNSKRFHSVESKKEINNYGTRKYVDVKIKRRKVSCL